MNKFIGIKFAEPFPLFTDGSHVKGDGNTGPFYAAGHVLSWWEDTPRNRAWKESSMQYWRERGYTPTLCETTN